MKTLQPSQSSQPLTARCQTCNTTPIDAAPLRRLACVALIGIATLLAVPSSRAADLPDFVGLVQNESDAVVHIEVIAGTQQAALGSGAEQSQVPESLRRFFGPDMPGDPSAPPEGGRGLGSGFVISSDGYVITNAHVVNGAESITVGLTDRREFDATLVGLDEASDIAVLKIEANDLPSVTIGNVDEVDVGEWVLAIGSPFGMERTATQGIVSAISRSLPSGTYVPFIQSDAAVNPGNSGGPLFNTDGEVIGVNSQIYSRSGGYQGLSFAIPIDIAMNVADQIMRDGYATRGWLGVSIQEVDTALATSFGLDRPHGALVAGVSDGAPADAAGVQVGDIIVEFDGAEIERSGTLPARVAAVAVGKHVSMKVLRDGKSIELDVKIGELEREAQVMPTLERPELARLGMATEAMPPAQKKEADVEYGVVVTAIADGGPAATAGIQVGDIIVTMAGEPIDDPAALVEQSTALDADRPVPVLIRRGDAARFLTLTPGEKVAS